MIELTITRDDEDRIVRIAYNPDTADETQRMEFCSIVRSIFSVGGEDEEEEEE